MNQGKIIGYLEKKAADVLGHEIDGKRCQFFVIDDPYDLDEFDKALKNKVQMPAMLAEFAEGYVGMNNSANYTDSINMFFMIVDKRKGSEPIRDVRERCKAWGMKVLTEMRKEKKADRIPGLLLDFVIDSNYAPVGPIALSYYGYQFSISLTLPFSF